MAGFLLLGALCLLAAGVALTVGIRYVDSSANRQLTAIYRQTDSPREFQTQRVAVIAVGILFTVAAIACFIASVTR